jgi:hypothetical protein
VLTETDNDVPERLIKSIRYFAVLYKSRMFCGRIILFLLVRDGNGDSLGIIAHYTRFKRSQTKQPGYVEPGE